jgi:CheY-like chemotaxis protein
LAIKPKIVVVGPPDSASDGAIAGLASLFELVRVPDIVSAAAHLGDGDVVGVFCLGPSEPFGLENRCPVWNARILEDLPDGVVLVDDENRVTWANERFRQLTATDELVGHSFYTVLGDPEILGPDFCPFHSALATGEPCTTKLRVAEKDYYQLHVVPVRGDVRGAGTLIAVVRDVTGEMHQQQKLEAIHQAGIELTDLKPEEVCEMTVDERVSLLKSNILHHTQDILDFNVVEVRLLEQTTGRLVVLLAEGIDQDAIRRPLYARPQDNGVTGFVASTGKSYLCEDTAEDPLYLQAFEGARSSLTVPLMLHDEVIGTFNVESPEPRAFTESDLLFLEIYARDVAVALNTLELLAAQRLSVVQKSIEAIHRAVALPIDRILNETVHVIESYIGHDTAITDRLKSILRNAREIKELIQEVGKDMAPAEAVPVVTQPSQQQRFRGVRILVVDEDEQILDSAHGILEEHGCTVETARTGGQAVFMVRSCPEGACYKVIISDVRLPDMTGHNLLVHLKKIIPGNVPLVLMQAFGYDPGHSIVKARQEGLHPKAVLFKPFLVDQLLDVIETILEWQKE